MAPGEKEKELLVVVKRGRDADYAEKLGSPLVRKDIRGRWPGMTWGQFRGNSEFDLRPLYNDGSPGPETDEAGCPIMVDTYTSVDDYKWSPLHSRWDPALAEVMLNQIRP